MLERICIPINDELSKVEYILSEEMISGFETVDSIARYVMKNGGKRVRPALFLLSARIARASGDYSRLAAALEMLHAATLMHDDVIDDAMVRRGQPSVKAKWGNQVSVLVGDLLLCRAARICESMKNPRLMEATIEAIGTTAEGELLEISHQNDVDVNKAVYMEIIQGKTAALFRLAARAGAIVANVDEFFEKALGEFGFALGQAFQLADDALDYVADEVRFGKTAGTDLREGKLTYPLIVALIKSSEEEKKIIRSALIAGRAASNELGQITDIIRRNDGIEATWRLAHDFALKAKRNLDAFRPSIERESLIALADYAVNRGE